MEWAVLRGEMRGAKRNKREGRVKEERKTFVLKIKGTEWPRAPGGGGEITQGFILELL